MVIYFIVDLPSYNMVDLSSSQTVNKRLPGRVNVEISYHIILYPNPMKPMNIRFTNQCYWVEPPFFQQSFVWLTDIAGGFFWR
jgi:hypothetical protein